MPGVGTTHHVKLGSEYLLVRPNSYSCRPAPTFGARFSTGDPDYNNLSFWQHWVQKDWVGGMGEDVWADGKMFDVAYRVNSRTKGELTLGRELEQGSGANWDLGGTGYGYKFANYNGTVYAIEINNPGADSKLYKYDSGTDGWTSVAMAGVRAFDLFVWNGAMIVCAQDTGTNNAYLVRMDTLGVWTDIALPAGLPATCWAGCGLSFGGKAYIAFQGDIWRLKTDWTWDGATAFFTSGLDPTEHWFSVAQEHLGYLYFMAYNGQLFRTDGNSMVEYWRFAGSNARAMATYDGRLFVLATEMEILEDGAGGTATVLYQLSGSSVTELKRWFGFAGTTQMVVFQRKLLFGLSEYRPPWYRTGFGLVAYDSAEDAYSFFAAQTDGVTYPLPATAWGGVGVGDGVVFCSVFGYGAFRTTLTGAGYTTLSDGGVLVSSRYDAGTPGLEKLWRKVTVDAYLPSANCSVVVEYSLTDGRTWVAVGTVTGVVDGPTVFYLENVRSPSLRYRLTLRTTTGSYSPKVRSVVVGYLPQPEPNWMWSFSVPVCDTWELMDGTGETKDPEALIDYLRTLYRNQVLVQFTDADGTSWADDGPGVLIYDIQTVLQNIESPLEGDIRITLLEAVETY